MNHSLNKIHPGKSNCSNIRFYRRYGSSSENSSKKTQKKEDSCPICSETVSIAYSIIFYLLNFITELLATTGFLSYKTASSTYPLMAFDFLFAGFALYALIRNFCKKDSTITSFNLAVKAVNTIMIPSLISCTLFSLADNMSSLSYPCAYISLSGAIFMIILSIVLKLALPYCQESLDKKEKELVQHV
jgi:hypothetical protein